MIYFAGRMEHWVEANQIVNKRRATVDAKHDYAIRISDSLNEFREKVCLINSGLDDRIVEIIKAVLIEKIGSTVKSLKVDEIRCMVRSDGCLEFDLLGKKSGAMVVAKDFYGYVSEKCMPMIERQDPNPIVVDLDWAIEFLSRNHFIVE
jgi:hypothetical protein